MDGQTVSSPGYAIRSVQPVTLRAATTSVAVQSPPSGSSASQTASPAIAVAPVVTVDFSGSKPGSYVLDWRDPTTHAVLLQVPMQSVLSTTPGLKGAATPEQIGTHVDTTA